MARSLKILYFAWVRERMGCAEERLDLPDTVQTVADVVDYLTRRDEAGALAFAHKTMIRAALDRRHVQPQTLLGAAQEIAFFPPMTGG